MNLAKYLNLLQWAAPALGVLISACSTEPWHPLDFSSQTEPVAVSSSALVGVDGNHTVTTANEVLNRYAPLRTDVAAGATSFQVNNLANLDSPQFGSLAVGDLLMIIQMQGATINGTDTANFGTVTALNGAGLYDLVMVASITPGGGGSGTIGTNCSGLRNSYTTARRTQVVRVPQLASLTVNAGASVAATPWDGSIGGIIALQVQNALALNGNLNANAAGFRGGAVEQNSGFDSTTYRTTDSTLGAEKGEGIAGFGADYDAFGGRYGRGAPANAGGGGNAHNAGGGGGANGNAGSTWTGQGVMTGSFPGQDPWRLDPAYIANGNARTNSSGGGRGGYSHSANNQDAVTVPPGNGSWGGDNRAPVGGLGGRPVTNDPGTRLFLGGGGGAGDSNNNMGGAGGRGGGLVWVVADMVSGTGRITANGQNGTDTTVTGNDAPGGGGAGGTVVVAAQELSGVIIDANGGRGGNQTIAGDEAEGPGGGGGGGYIAVSGGTVTRNVAGGANGTSNSAAVTEFTQNGATAGAAGQLGAAVVTLPLCLLSDLAITKTDGVTSLIPGNTVTYTLTVTNNGPNAVGGATVTDNFPAALTGASWTCAPAAACGTTSGTGNISAVPVTLASGGTATFMVTATVNPSATGTLTNTASVAVPIGHTDPTPGNNSATDTDTLTPRADLAVALTDSPDPVNGNVTLTYTVNVSNLGPSNAASVIAVLNLPTGVAFISAEGAGWMCSQADGAVTCTRPSADPGAAPAITVQVTAPNVSGSVTASASVDAITADPVASNGTASQSTTVGPKAPVVSAPVAFVNTQRPVIAGTAQAGGTVKVFLDGSEAGTTPVNPEGLWAFIAAGALTEGLHRVIATVTDAAGNVSPDSNVHSFTVDSVPPEVPVVSAPVAFVNTQRPVIAGTAQAGGTVKVFLDGSEAGATPANSEGLWVFIAAGALTEGLHRVIATVTDAAGNVSPGSNVHSFTVDTVPPEVPVVSAPGPFTNIQKPGIHGTAEPDSTVAMRLDGAEARIARADTQGHWMFVLSTDLSEGRHQIEVTATDAAENVKPVSAFHSFEIDLKRPDAPAVLAPGPFINIQKPDIAGKAEPGSTITLRLDGIVEKEVITAENGLWGFALQRDLDEKLYRVEATATDAAGNVSDPSKPHSFTIDLGAPDPPEVNSPGAFVDTPRPVIGGKAEAGSEVKVELDGIEVGTPKADDTGAWSFTSATALAAGTYRVVATAKDSAGNLSKPSAEYSFSIKRSHYGWDCACAPALPATWILLTLAWFGGRSGGGARHRAQGPTPEQPARRAPGPD